MSTLNVTNLVVPGTATISATTLNATTLQTNTIKHTNGTNALLIDSVGRVTRPNSPAIILDGNNPNWVQFPVADQTSILTTTHYQQLFSSGGITWSSGLVTVPVAGVYRVCGQIYTSGTGGGTVGLVPRDQGRLYVMRNTALMFLIHAYSAAGDGSIFYTGLVNMSAGDHFKLTVSDAISMYMGNVHTRFCVELI